MQEFNIDCIFLHYFDIHFLNEVFRTSNRNNVIFELNMATRLALLMADDLYLPASSFCENDTCREILLRLEPLFKYGKIHILGKNPDILDFIEDKKNQYPEDSVQFKKYLLIENGDKQLPPFLPRTHSSTKDISDGWLKQQNNLHTIFQGVPELLTPEFSKRWAAVPDELQGKAFVFDHVSKILNTGNDNFLIKRKIRDIINEYYFSSYTREYGIGIVEGLNYLNTPFKINYSGNTFHYNKLLSIVQQDKSLFVKVRDDNAEDLYILKSSKIWRRRQEQYIEKHVMKEEKSSIAYSFPEASKGDIGIIVALPEELDAMKHVFEMKEIFINQQLFFMAEVISDSMIRHQIIFSLLPEKGNNMAAIVSAKMITMVPSIKLILACGIAGAIPNVESPEGDVRLGDIVVSNSFGVIQYDNSKKFPENIEFNALPRPPCPICVKTIKNFFSDYTNKMKRCNELIDMCIKKNNKFNRPSSENDVLFDSANRKIPRINSENRNENEPKLHLGVIASGNMLIKDPKNRDELGRRLNARVIEMEASGVADCAWLGKIGYFIIRGTCDYCDMHKNDMWHNYAALVAAAFTRTLIENLSDEL